MAVGVFTLTRDHIIKGERMVDQTTPSAITTAGAVTYTADQIYGGIILRDPNGAGRTDILPTAALLVSFMQEEQIGDTLFCTIINTADAAETITIQAGSGGAFDAAQPAASKAIAQNTSKQLIIRITGIAAGSEAYVVYM